MWKDAGNHKGIPLRSGVIPELLVEAHMASLQQAEQDKPWILHTYKHLVQHHLSRQKGEFKGWSAKLFKTAASIANQQFNAMLHKRRGGLLDDVGAREGALAQTLALQRRMPYSLHPSPSKTSRSAEALKPPKALVYTVVEGSALSQPVWPHFVDQGIPALERKIGLFILDPPMGLQKAGEGTSNDPWALDNALRAINLVFSSCPAHFVIAMFSLWDLATMQAALGNDKDLKRAQLEVSQLVMVKTGRPPLAGVHTSSHMVQHVLLIKTKGAALNFSTSGPDPVRYFHPVNGEEACNDVKVDANGFFKTAGNQVVNPTQKPLLQLEYLIRTCMQPDTHVVVDLCCGSGSGCVAALRMGYHVVGIDRNSTQVEEARRRLKIFTDNEVIENRGLDFTEDQFTKNQAEKQEKQAAAADITPVEIV